MATQIITRQLCDYCQHDDGVETAETERHLVTLGGDEYELDVCATHVKPLIDLKASLDEVARKVPRRGRKANAPSLIRESTDPNHAGVLCPECGQVLKNRQSLAAHSRQTHDKTLPELEGKTPTLPCPTCGKLYVNAAGLAAHKRVHVK